MRYEAGWILIGLTILNLSINWFILVGNMAKKLKKKLKSGIQIVKDFCNNLSNKKKEDKQSTIQIKPDYSQKSSTTTMNDQGTSLSLRQNESQFWTIRNEFQFQIRNVSGNGSTIPIEAVTIDNENQLQDDSQPTMRKDADEEKGNAEPMKSEKLYKSQQMLSNKYQSYKNIGHISNNKPQGYQGNLKDVFEISTPQFSNHLAQANRNFNSLGNQNIKSTLYQSNENKQQPKNQ